MEKKEPKTYKRPAWVKSGEEELCPDCFKVVGERSRYNLVCMLGKAKDGMTVGELTLRPGISLSQGLLGPMLTGDYRVLQPDLPIAFP